MLSVDRSQHSRSGHANINVDITDDSSSRAIPAVRSEDISGQQESHEYTQLQILHEEYTQLQLRDRPSNSRELPDNVYETISGEQPREASALWNPWGRKTPIQASSHAVLIGCIHQRFREELIHAVVSVGGIDVRKYYYFQLRCSFLSWCKVSCSKFAVLNQCQQDQHVYCICTCTTYNWWHGHRSTQLCCLMDML